VPIGGNATNEFSGNKKNSTPERPGRGRETTEEKEKDNAGIVNSCEEKKKGKEDGTATSGEGGGAGKVL